MGRRALTAQERADRQIQRQEALRTKQTLELARECALDPNLRVVVDSTLPASYASQTTTATIGAFESTYSINSNLMASVLTIRLIWLDPPYANEDDNPLNPLARERHTASTPYEPPSLPGRSNTQQDVESHDAPLIVELSALAISGDGPAPSGVAINNPIGFSPAEASTQPPPLTGQHDKYYHGNNNQSFQLDGNAQVSSPEAYHTMRSVTPSPSSPSLFYQDDHAVFEPGSPSHTSDIRGGFTSSTSAPSPSGPGDPVLDGFLRSIYDQSTSRGQQGPRSCEIAEPGRTHTLQERTEYIQRYLPPLQSIFAEPGAEIHNPCTSVSRWEKLLSDRPPEPLSFRKTQASLSTKSVTITRQWDVDSIWLGAKSLSAIRPPNRFRLSFFPSHKSNIATNQIIQPHGLDLAHTRHTSIGSFSTGNVRFNVLVFFPNGSRSPTPASANSLSLDRFRDLYDDIIIPAAYETLPDHVKQEIPSSYDLIYAKSRAYQEKPGAGRWTANDESRTFRLAYSVPAEFLSQFWASVVQKANSHRMQTLRGKTIAYYQNPCLLFQAHDLKNVFAQPNLHESLVLFRDAILAGLDPEHLDLHSCWLDLGMRDHVSRQHQGQASSQNNQSSQHEPWTLLWKSACCRHLHRRLGGIVPEAPLDARYYRSSLLRDAGTYYTKARPTKSSNPGHPETRSPGIIRAKAYDCKRELFGVMFSDYKLFSSGFLPLLAFDEGMLRDLAGMDQNRQRAFAPKLSRSHIMRAWDANKRHLRAVSSARWYPNFGIRKEVTFRLDVILTMFARGALHPDLSTHTGPMAQEIPLNPSSDTQHYPYWIVPTSAVQSFISTQAARFILPLDDIFQEVTRKTVEGSPSTSSLDPVRQILAFYTAQLFGRLLIYALNEEDQEQHFDNWIWRSAWSVRPRGRSSVSVRRGLGLSAPIESTGMLWIPQSHVDWQRGNLSLEVLIHLYMARSPLQARLAHQPNVQVLTVSHVAVKRLFQRWLHDAQLSHDMDCPEKAKEYADKAIALAVEETARAYYQHFLAKLGSYWDRVRNKVGHQSLSALSRLQRAQDESTADTASILSAQTIRAIYEEAWAGYNQATSAGCDLAEQAAGGNMSDELPCWMATRQRLPPKDSWSDFVFGVLFHHPHAQPKWSQLYFLQLYRSFRELWGDVSVWAGQFDKHFGIRIGHYIRVMFNTDRSKEVGTSHGEGTWYHGKPPFFQIQLWAPYFSPPQRQKGIPLSSVYHCLRYPDGLSPSITSSVPTARDFQALDELIREHWIEIVDDVDVLCSASHSYIRRHCRSALLYVRFLSGPTWGQDGGVSFMQPWSIKPQDIQDCVEEDVFRVPVVQKSIPKHMLESIASQPTFFLPTRDNVLGLLETIESLPGHSASFIARLSWTKCRMDNGGDQYDLRSHLGVKKQVAEPSDRRQMLLEQFLRQTEPPETEATSENILDVVDVQEGNEYEVMREGEVTDEDGGRSHGDENIFSEDSECG
ncbi:hypothetical protein FPOAC2_13287 [Fusarium poae]